MPSRPTAKGTTSSKLGVQARRGSTASSARASSAKTGTKPASKVAARRVSETKVKAPVARMAVDLKNDRARNGWLVAGFMALFGVTALTQLNAQILNRGEVLQKAVAAYRFDVDFEPRARRGTILSADGKVMAESQDASVFSLDYSKVPNSPGFFMALSAASGISVAELQAPALEGARRRTWANPLPADVTRRIRKVQSDWQADGVSLEKVLVRAYPLGPAASTVVGLVRDGDAISGLERSKAEQLAGTDGKAKGFFDRTGLFVPIRGSEIRERVNGSDLTLTIDSEIQLEATQALRNAVTKHGATSGTVIVIEPSTGDILAMANWPSFDPTAPIAAGSDFNMATMGAYEPGSTWKIMTLAAALETGAVPSDWTGHCTGSIHVANGKVVRCSHGAHGHVDLERAIAESCNTSTVRWGLALGRPEMVEFMRNLRLFDAPQLGMPSERAGRFREDDSPILQLSNLSFGQAMNASPVRLAAAYAALGNDGKLVTPRLIRAIDGKAQQVIEERQIVSPAVAALVRSTMVATVSESFGTGKAARLPGYTLAGKTGTAQKLQRGGLQGYVSNFVGYVPADKPRAMILVMVDNPTQGGYYGGTVAAPVFGDVARAVIRRKGIAPDAERRGFKPDWIEQALSTARAGQSKATPDAAAAAAATTPAAGSNPSPRAARPAAAEPASTPTPPRRRFNVDVPVTVTVRESR